MCQTRLKMTKISLRIDTHHRHCWILLCKRVASKSGIIKKHKAVINRQLTQAVFFCKILKSLFRQNTFITWKNSYLIHRVVLSHIWKWIRQMLLHTRGSNLVHGILDNVRVKTSWRLFVWSPEDVLKSSSG